MGVDTHRCLDLSLHKTYCHWYSVQFLCNVAYLSLACFPSKESFSDIHPCTEAISDEAWTARWSRPVSGLCCSSFYFLKTWHWDTVWSRYVFRPATSCVVLHLSYFLTFLKDALYTMHMSANRSLGTTLFSQTYYFMPVKLCFLWLFLVN